MARKLSEKAQAAVDGVLAKFKAGDLSPLIRYIRIKRAAGDQGLPSDSWSFGNQALAYLSTGSEDARGFNQWKAVGRKVKKGAKAGYIFIPCFSGKDGKGGAPSGGWKPEDRVPPSGEGPDDGADDGADDGKKGPFLIGFKAIPVFGRQDTVTADGVDDYIEPDYGPAEPPPFVGVAKAWNLPVVYSPHVRQSYWGAYYHSGRIELLTHDESVFFHELAHAAHHRIDGADYPGQTQAGRAKKEAVAEFSACVLKAYCGLGDTSGKAWSYIQGYHADPLKAILGILSKASETIGLILDTAEAIEAGKAAA